MSRHPSTPEHDRPSGSPLGGAVSLEWKLPLLMTGLLAAGLAGMLAFTYATLARRAEEVVRDRLVHSVDQIAQSAEGAMAHRTASLRELARDPSMARPLLSVRRGESAHSVDLAAARAALDAVRSTADSLPVELWDARGRVVARSGRAIAAGERAAAPLAAWAEADSARLGPLYDAGGRVRFWVVAPVEAEGGRVGFVAWVRNVGGPRNATEFLRAFTREDFRMYTRNADGTVWTDASGAPVAAPIRRKEGSRGTWHVRRGQGRMAVAERAVAGTPWVMALETPERWLTARSRATLRPLAAVALALVVIGALLARAASRRVTRPLATLTAAAEALARGRYEPRAAGAGRDEIGRLAASFDAMAAQVAAARAELEHRVADAEAARAEAEHANRAKSDFLAVMSHELRTPLNAIGGYAQLLEMGIHGPVTDAQREALARIERSQAHLLALINDVLSFARIDAGQVRYDLQDLPVADALAEVEAVVAPQMRAAGLAFHPLPCAAGVVARADGDKVRQVLLNLLSNAVKYTPAGGAVTVECEADERRVRVHVRDTGTGIRPERLGVIFEPFVQGERALNRPDEGVGLGLSISRDLACGMGGDLRVESEAGKGSTFTLELPRAGAPPEGILPGVPRLRPESGSVPAAG